LQRRNSFTRRNNNDFVELKTSLLPSHFGLFIPPNLQMKKEVVVGVTDPDYQGEFGWLSHHKGKDEYVCNTGYPLGYLLVLLCSVIKIKGNLRQLHPSRTSIDLGP
jgi:hypothetical protein